MNNSSYQPVKFTFLKYVLMFFPGKVHFLLSLFEYIVCNYAVLLIILRCDKQNI